MTEKKKVALVTGGGSGIGRVIALRLAEEGYSVVVNDVVEAAALGVAKEIAQAGGDADGAAGDIASAADRASVIDFIARKYGRLDLLVNNAGVAPRERRDILAATEEEYDRVMSINLKGPYFLTQSAANKMIEWKKTGKAEPRVVFITSISAYTSSTQRGEYCLSKAGLSMAAKLFADRLGEYGIPVIEIRPGIIETPMIAKVKDKYEKLIDGGLLPTRRLGKPEDVAGVVAAFARGELDYSTGEAIEVSGGFGVRRL